MLIIIIIISIILISFVSYYFFIKKVDCKVGEWSNWNECSKECDGGLQTRNRKVLIKPKNKGLECPILEEKKACNTNPCDVDCKVSDWTQWGDCSTACNGGIQKRFRKIEIPQKGKGKECPSDLEEKRECNTQLCHVQIFIDMMKRIFSTDIINRNDLFSNVEAIEIKICGFPGKLTTDISNNLKRIEKLYNYSLSNYNDTYSMLFDISLFMFYKMIYTRKINDGDIVYNTDTQIITTNPSSKFFIDMQTNYPEIGLQIEMDYRYFFDSLKKYFNIIRKDMKPISKEDACAFETGCVLDCNSDNVKEALINYITKPGVVYNVSLDRIIKVDKNDCDVTYSSQYYNFGLTTDRHKFTLQPDANCNYSKERIMIGPPIFE